MKIFLSVLLSALLLFSLAACGGAPAEPQNEHEAVIPANEPDAVTSASPNESGDPEAIIRNLSSDGYWLIVVLNDVEIDREIIVSGEFHQRDDPAGPLYRKLALYAQDSNRNITEIYTMTVPGIVVESPNFRIQNGIIKGNVYVNAEGFDLFGAVIEGDLTFAKQEYMDSALIEENGGVVTGTVSVE